MVTYKQILKIIQDHEENGKCQKLDSLEFISVYPYFFKMHVGKHSFIQGTLVDVGDGFIRVGVANLTEHDEVGTIDLEDIKDFDMRSE